MPTAVQTLLLTSVPSFAAALDQIAPGALRALWLPGLTDALTNVSPFTLPSAPGRVWTYNATAQGRITPQGRGVLVSFDGTQGLTTPDTADMSFNTGGLTDLPFSGVELVNVTVSGTSRTLIAKWNDGGANDEYRFTAFSNKLTLFLKDPSASVAASRQQNGTYTPAVAMLAAFSYDGGGGATAANGITLYQNGALVASTATNNASYVAMEDKALTPAVGSDSSNAQNITGSLGFAAVFAANLSAAQHGAIKNLVNQWFGLSL